MKGTLQVIALSLALFFSSHDAAAQFGNQPYMFVYDGKSYELVKTNLSWFDAADAAVQKGGVLAEINSQEEQDSIYYQVKNNAGIQSYQTSAPDGGGAGYVWLGGNDVATEGKWIWDGGYSGNGPQFWQGLSVSHGGSPVGGLYSNWGNEPDNFGTYGQDALGLAISNLPYGTASQWNDISAGNLLYYLIEYPDIVPVEMSLFSATVFNDNVVLTWSTESETNNFGWNVERRAERGTWSTIGFIEGSGSTTGQRKYSFTDDASALSGRIEYRLKQIDYDNTSAYSAILQVELSPSSGVQSGTPLPATRLLQAYPQPATTQLHIPFETDGGSPVSLQLYNSMGQRLYTIRDAELLPVGSHTVSVSAGDLPAGIYLLVLKSGTLQLTQRVTITR